MLILTRSPETLFILYTVEFIVSGLVLTVLAWLVLQEPARREQLVGWIVSFLLLVVSLGLGAWTSYGLLVEAEESRLVAFQFAAAGLLETSGLAGVAWTILRPRIGAWAALGAVAVVAELAALTAVGPWPGYPPSPPHLGATVAVSLFAALGIALRAKDEVRDAGTAFLLLAAGGGTSALVGWGTVTDPWWNLSSALTLLGLAGLALTVERRSRDLFVQVFLRLNLTFIFLAGVLMALAAQAERSRRLDFSRRGLDGLAEFLRGQIMYYMANGRTSGDILTSPVIFRRIVSDFRNHQDLRIIRIRLGEETLSVSIDDDGMISRRANAEGDPSPLDSHQAPTVMVAEWPIFFSGDSVGSVSFEETRLSVNREIAGSILVIFFALTSAVGVGSVLIGAIVYQAGERLRRQVKQIEQTERQLMQAARLASIGQLVSGVAHEINNPLGVVTSRTEYVRELVAERMLDDELAGDLEVISRQARRITRIVQDLLGFARSQPMQLRPVSLADVVDHSVELTKTSLTNASIQTEVELPHWLPSVKADPDRLEQVLVNLIMNAVDSMPNGGRIRIRAAGGHDDIVLTVEDTGRGMSEEDLKRAFDPFFSTKDGKGTGLGLSISYGIIRDHGGKIWAESELGRGSTFFVSLPLQKPRENHR